jgi:hypothetical protein
VVPVIKRRTGAGRDSPQRRIVELGIFFGQRFIIRKSASLSADDFPRQESEIDSLAPARSASRPARLCRGLPARSILRSAQNEMAPVNL